MLDAFAVQVTRVAVLAENKLAFEGDSETADQNFLIVLAEVETHTSGSEKECLFVNWERLTYIEQDWYYMGKRGPTDSGMCMLVVEISSSFRIGCILQWEVDKQLWVALGNIHYSVA